MLMTEVLPEPDGPKRTVIRPVERKVTSICVSPRRFDTSMFSMAVPACRVVETIWAGIAVSSGQKTLHLGDGPGEEEFRERYEP